MNEANTKDLIMNTAEKLYASKGFGSVSLRDIIRQAGVNTAAVHYHFRSREGLVRAILTRRSKPINDRRLEELDALEAQHPTGELPLEGVIESFLSPVIHMLGDSAGGTKLFPRLMAWAISEPDPKFREIIRVTFDHVIRRFFCALKSALPPMPDEEIFWRFHFMLGAMAFTVAVPMAHADMDTWPDGKDADRIIKRLVGFTAAGMRAMEIGPEEKGSS